jgi:hypothetical protein
MMWATAARILREHAEELAACVKVKTSWLFGNCRDRQPVMHLFCGKIAWRMTAYVKNHGNSQ